MKVAILAGGLGTRFAEETETKPKPMIHIGGRPIIWHIMMHYYAYNHKDFVIALGYKGELIKRFMSDYASLNGNLKISMRDGVIERQTSNLPDWKVDLVETGPFTNTGGRIKRLKDSIGNERFMLTWGDGVSDVDLDKLLAFHKSHGKLATVTAVRPTARFGHLEIENDRITEFSEKPQTSEGWINGAFFILEPEVFDYIEGDKTLFEKEPLESLAREGQLMAFKHHSFWQCMDTMRDKKRLESFWSKGDAPWKTWKDKL
jgi:glucose-1-phosphate cytidylyltransferase